MGNNQERKVIVVFDVETGRLIAKELVKAGAEVLIITRAREGAKVLQKVMEKSEGESLIFALDPMDAEAVEQAAIETEKRFGQIDIWVNPPLNGTIHVNQKKNSEKHKQLTEKSYLVQVYGTLSALRRMLPRNKGRIVFIGSEMLYTGSPYRVSCFASKKAIMGFYKLIKSELYNDNRDIYVNMITLSNLEFTEKVGNGGVIREKLAFMKSVDTSILAVEAIKYLAKDSRVEGF